MRNHEPPMDLRGDCVATAYERCPACGDPTDYCQGHGEIGDPKGWITLNEHEHGIHDNCVRVSEVIMEGGEAN